MSKTFGEMTPAERRAATDRAVTQLQDELRASAGAIGQIMDEAFCPGSGQRWGSGDGHPICPVCHRRPAGLGAERPERRQHGGWAGTVPNHERRTP